MGEYFLFVNIDKQEYLNPGQFNENNKRGGLLVGMHAVALGWLVSDSSYLAKPYPFGSWYGNRIIIAGDYEKPDIHDIKTSCASNPDRNLYWLASEEFENISNKAISMLCEQNANYTEHFVKIAEKNDFMLIELGTAVFVNNSSTIKEMLEKIIGPNWVKRYKEACQQFPHRK